MTHPLASGLVRRLPAVASTMDEARAAMDGPRIVGVRAARQTQGRGRRGAAWMDWPGSRLLVTYILRGPDCAADVRHRLALLAGVAAAEACDATCGTACGLKWPNDLLLAGRKVGGLLLEAPARDVALLGVGINVGGCGTPGPPGAGALLAEADDAVCDRLEEALRARIDAWRALLAQGHWDQLVAAWRLRDPTAGTRYRAQTDEGTVCGEAAGISDEGLLLLRLPDGRMVETASATSAFD
ncbi:MAG: biotin--[acetyl-CoA-carboxylase] ligase [Armatimonadetes bacterium]|nr:biotin--[acetyl-CoA-carboxylase] ligase [Armatimonadota bacterium]